MSDNFGEAVHNFFKNRQHLVDVIELELEDFKKSTDRLAAEYELQTGKKVTFVRVNRLREEREREKSKKLNSELNADLPK